jgi:hypothetical protein
LTEEFSVVQARKSTLLVAGVLALLGGWQVHRSHSTAAIAFGVTAGVLLVCAAIPVAAVWFHKWWMAFAGVLGFVNSRILLSLFFYLVMAPVGLIVRRAGHDPLERRSGRGASYWRPRISTRQSRESYERSF